MDLEIRIKIKHKPSFGGFNKEELISDLQWQFVEITGYKPESIEVDTL